VSDVTIPDGTVVLADTNFTKTWRVRNTGVCAWTKGYALVFWDGEQLGAPDAILLRSEVVPGQTVDLPLVMTAPSSAGLHAGYWRFRDPNGFLFGVGLTGADALRVVINVSVPAATSTPTQLIFGLVLENP
jgi:hypothetical protein